MTEPPATDTAPRTYAVASEEPRNPDTAALPWLHLRLGIHFDDAYDDSGDRRHELAVLAVDAGRRMLDLHDALADATNTLSHQYRRDSTLASQREVRRADADTTAGGVLRAAELHGRVAELDHTLEMIGRAFKLAWVQPGV